MAKDQAIGAAIFIASIAGLVVYFWLVFLSPQSWQFLTIQITAFLGVGIVLAILAWIGYTLATTPTPEPIPEVATESETKSAEGEQEKSG